MPVKQPPFTTDKTYFAHDVRNWIAAHPSVPPWTTDQINNTIDTLWFADRQLQIRPQYRAHMQDAANNMNLANLIPGAMAIPQNPYTEGEKNHAKRYRTLPQPAAGVAAPAAPVAQIAPAMALGAITAVGVAPAAPPVASQAAPSAASGLAPSLYWYPFDFHPRLPWDDESDIPELPNFEGVRRPSEAPRECDEFLRSGILRHQEDDADWRGQKVLGFGNFGVAGLWVQLDAQNNVIEQIVAKDCNPWTREKWRDPVHWRDRLPREIANHRRIDRRRSQNSNREMAYRNLVEHRGYRLMMRKRRYRLYLKYYSGGHLEKALQPVFEDWVLGKGQEWDFDDPNCFDDLNQIPEELIWHVFQSLVRACLFLQYGTSDPAVTAPEPDWRPITHADITMGNIFIEPRDPSDDFDLSNVVLADYGESFFPLEIPPRNADEPLYPSDNPVDYVHECSSTRRPYEQHFAREDENGILIPINEKTDVWMIGAVIWRLLSYNTDDRGPVREDLEAEVEVVEVDENGQPTRQLKDVPIKVPISMGDSTDVLTEAAMLPSVSEFFPMAANWTAELKRLVRECLNYGPGDRLTLHQLNEDIEAHLASNPVLQEGPELLDTAGERMEGIE
ncbi:hypothetical protein E8E13_009505 [Curvularia kusanoi]|uniref:Protein kinase domain-containing protein n=1 Tax=Curvularia kusanoi TaxID=90978 RepID=A0A9P4WAW7_CURKU|nr:hypothetical protein E8E13_009505 [Curvularia kusanoi]